MFLLKFYIFIKFVGYYNIMVFCFIKKCDLDNFIVKILYYLNIF